MPTATPLPIVLGITIPFAGGNATKAARFGAKPNDGTHASPKKLQRSDFNWWTWQGTNYTGPAGQNDNFDKTELHLILDQAVAGNYQIIGMCGYTPPWARRPGVTTDKELPNDARDIANFIYNVCREAERYAPGVLVLVEFWNEPNQRPFVQTPDVATYGNYLDVVYAAQKDGTITGRSDNGTRPVNAIQLMTGGTGAAPSVGDPNRHKNWSIYLIDHHTNSFDHIGIHPYPSTGPIGANNGWDPGWNDVPYISAELHIKGRDDAQIIATEFGWQTPSHITLANAAVWLPQSWSWWTARSAPRDGTGIHFGLGPLCVFECDDTTSSPTGYDDLQGLYTFGTGQGDGAPKVDSQGRALYRDAWLAIAGAADTTAPTAAINYPHNGDSLSGDFTIYALASDGYDPVTNPAATPNSALKVWIFADGSSTPLNSSPLPYAHAEAFGWNFSLTVTGGDGSWTDGNHTFKVKVQDQAGNSYTTPVPVTLSLQNNVGAPSISSVSPGLGSTAGGYTVDVHGSHFAAGDTVLFGNKSAVTSLVDATHLQATAPAVANPKSVDIRVVRVDGTTSDKVPEDQFTFQSPTPPPANTPTVTKVTPNSGPTNGGTLVVVEGTNFTDVPQGSQGGSAPGLPYGGYAGEADATPADPSIPNRFEHWVAFGASTPTRQDVDDMLAAGIDGVRLGFIDWDGADPTHNGSFSMPQRWIDTVQYMNDQGLDIILQLSIGNTFGGANNSTDFGQGFRHDARAHHADGSEYGPVVDVPVMFSKYCVNTIKFFDGKGGRPLITKFEVFNEVNHFKFDDGLHSGVAPTWDPAHPTVNFKAQAYLEYLVRIYPEAKAARIAAGSPCRIATSGLGGHQDSPSDVDSVVFIEDLFGYQADGTTPRSQFAYNGRTYSVYTDRLFDRVSFHPYCYWNTPSDDITEKHPRGWGGMLAIRATLDAHGFEWVIIDVTEWGQPVESGTNPAHTLLMSANATQDALNLWNSYPWAGVFCIFSWSDGGEAAAKGRLFGLVHPDPTTGAAVPNNPRYKVYKTAAQARDTTPAPALIAASPNKAQPAGGKLIAVYGQFFDGSSVPHIGGVACTNVTLVDSETITCKTPVLPSGLTKLVVPNVNGPSTESVDFQIGAVQTGHDPTVTGLLPGSGPLAGGTHVVISGTHFDEVITSDPTAVQFGGVNATSYTVDSPTQITAVAPANPTGGMVNVVVTNPTNSSLIGAASQFIYVGGVPTVAAVEVELPDTSTIDDLTQPITVSGTSVFTCSADSDTPISGAWLETASGSFLANLINTFGDLYSGEDNTTVLADGVYTWRFAARNATGIGYSPSFVAVVDNGVPTDPTLGVYFGTVKASAVSVINATKLQALSPAAATAGPVDVVVANGAGSSPVTPADVFTYYDAPTGQIVSVTLPDGTVVAPPSGTITGLTTLSLTSSDTTITRMALLEGLHHETVLGTCSRAEDGSWEIQHETRLLPNGNHTYWPRMHLANGEFITGSPVILFVFNGTTSGGGPTSKVTNTDVPPPPEIVNAILGPSTKVTRRADILNADGSMFRSNVPIWSGQVTVDASQDERRSFQCELGFRDSDPNAGTDAALRLGIENLWFDKLIRLYRGVDTPTMLWECVLGTFMLDTIEEPHFPGQFALTGRDLTKKLITSKLTAPAMFAAGADIGELVTAVATNAGITKVVLPWDQVNIAPQLAADVTFDQGTTRYEIIKTILQGIAYEAFIDRYGWLIVRPYQDPATMPPMWTFETGPLRGHLISWKKSASDALLFNHVVVIGGDDSSDPIYAEAVVTDPSSPVWPGDGSGNGIGDRVADPIENTTITSVEQAQALADAQLRYAALEQFDVNFGTLVLPWLEAATVVDFLDPDPSANGDPTRFLLEDFTIPMDLSEMDAHAGRIALVTV